MLTHEAKANVARNYRRLFEDKHGKPFPGSDNIIIEFWTNASGAPTPGDQDAWVLEDMERV